eukprot:EG_transcript_50377
MVAQGNFPEAIRFLTAALQETPRDEALYGMRSTAYSSVGNFEASLIDAEACIKLNPRSQRGHASRGLALIRLGRLEDAEAALQRARDLPPMDDAGAADVQLGWQQLQRAWADRRAQEA